MLPVLFCYTIISIHALLAESDSKKSPPMCFIRHFYPRSPCGERRSPVSASTNCAAYFYPRSPCGERPPRGDLRYLDNIISIHALLAESDGIGLVFLWWGVRFLSTLSLRRATIVSSGMPSEIMYFYPRSPCGERPTVSALFRCPMVISIHALLAESDCNLQRLLKCPENFYPRSPCGERLRSTAKPLALDNISIHALLAESDGAIGAFFSVYVHFYPRSPCGERPADWEREGSQNADFYPRSPCGERQHKSGFLISWSRFLSTLSLRRATPERSRAIRIISHFYPRSPCGERPFGVHLDTPNSSFLSTLSLRRATPPFRRSSQRLLFLSTLSLRRATTGSNVRKQDVHDFYPRSPCGERQESQQPSARPTTISIHALLAESDRAL